jgi:hypothetical protein
MALGGEFVEAWREEGTSASRIALVVPKGTTMAVGFIVEMIDDQIIVTMPGTLFIAAYRKREGMGALVGSFVRDDRHAGIPRSEFVARSWRLALAKAKQLGWISN